MVGRSGWREALILGLSTGALALTQPALLPLPICLGLVAAFRARLEVLIRLAARSIPVAVVLMVPWWIRNWLLFGSFVPLTTSAGHSMMHVVNRDHAPFLPTC
jgi:4-amino-4-deoxy-L-arabinose transferase-like glycosyltransferase